MPSVETVEQRVTELVAEVEREYASLGKELRWPLVRALIHRAVHVAAEGAGVEFCMLASYLAEMIGHSHTLMHGDGSQPGAHQKNVH